MRKCLLFFLLIAPFLGCTQLNGNVVSIADGDTFTMLVNEEQIKIRLYGIDCPEKGQDYGKVAKDFLAGMIAGKIVEVESMDIDRYGRTIGIVFVDEVNVNEALLKAGLAWHYTDYDNNPAWAKFEEAARLEKLNIWSMKDPLAPWEWRKNKRKKN